MDLKIVLTDKSLTLREREEIKNKFADTCESVFAKYNDTVNSVELITIDTIEKNITLQVVLISGVINQNAGSDLL